MEHAEAMESFGDYFVGTLSREKTRAFHAHVEGCEDCRVRIRATRAAAGSPGFVRGGASEAEQKDRMEKLLYRNRVMTYAVIAILIGFFILFRLRR